MGMLNQQQRPATPELPMTIADAELLDEDLSADEPAEDTDEDDTVLPHSVEVWSKACFGCNTFNTSGSAKHNGPDFACHFDNGNAMCPGARYGVVILGPKIKALTELRAVIAAHGRNSVTYVTQLGKVLAGLPTDDDRSFVMNSLNS
jgi:hypothetical protein